MMSANELFPMGRIVATPGAIEVLRSMSADGNHQHAAAELLARHHSGDWGDVSEHDIQANQDALEHGNRLMSVYGDDHHNRLYVITDADRSVTTILRPEDY